MPSKTWLLGFRALRVQGLIRLGFRVPGFRVPGFRGLGFQGSGFRVPGLCCRRHLAAKCSRNREDLGIEALGGFRLYGFTVREGVGDPQHQKIVVFLRGSLVHVGGLGIIYGS